MSNLSQDQLDKRAAIQKTATIWGAIVGIIAGLLAFWLLGGQGSAIRYGGAVVIALVAGFLVYRASFNSGAKSSLCEACGAAFSRSRTDRSETVASSEAKEEREEQPDKSTKVTTWTEDKLDVVETHTCAKCGDTTTREFQSSRRRDEKSTVEPYVPPKAGGSSGKGGDEAGGDEAPAPAKSARTRKRGG